jgi:ATP-dependent exoDNAse (exonuclease V) alpha subunit
LPANAPDWSANRAALWNAAEQSETRKNSTVAREFEIALPSELSPEERKRFAVDFAKEIVARHRCAADVAIHAPGKGGDNRNHHAHILCSTRRLTPKGFTEKTRELDERKSGEVDRWRERFAELQNERFQENGIDAQVDHRSLKAQGIDREPAEHLGVAATGYERRTGQASDKRLAFEREAAERLARAKEIGEIEREAKELESSIIDLSGSLSAAKAERDRQKQNDAQAQTEKQQVGLIPTKRLIEPVLRQEVRPSELSPVECAEQTRERFFNEARET